MILLNTAKKKNLSMLIGKIRLRLLLRKLAWRDITLALGKQVLARVR